MKDAIKQGIYMKKIEWMSAFKKIESSLTIYSIYSVKNIGMMAAETIIAPVRTNLITILTGVVRYQSQAEVFIIPELTK